MANKLNKNDARYYRYLGKIGSKLLYVTPMWANRATKFAICRNAMIRITRTYHTISADTALHFTETTTGDLLALEMLRNRLKLTTRTEPSL